MSYRIEFERRALQQIKKFPPQICRKVMRKIRTLQENPCRYPLLSTAFSKLRKVVVGASGGEYRMVYLNPPSKKVKNLFDPVKIG